MDSTEPAIQTTSASPQNGPLEANVNPWRRAWQANAGIFRLVFLFGILLFSFWVGMDAHWDYRFPLHVDEWFALGYSQSTLEAEGLKYPDPYGGEDVSFHPEMGLHMLLATLKATTGLSWLGLYQIAPGLLMALMAFLTYAFGRRLGFGWSAALLVPLIPTSVRTLGPAFVVPVSVAMLFIPVTLMLLHILERERWSLTLSLLLVLITGAIFIHPTTEGVIAAIAVIYLGSMVVVAIAGGRLRRGAQLMVSMGLRGIIPVAALGFWLPSLSKEIFTRSVTDARGDYLTLLGTHRGFFEAFGWVGLVVALLGLAMLVLRRGWGPLSYAIPIFTGILYLFLMVFPSYQAGPDILYERGWVYLGFVLALLAAYFIALYFRHAHELLARWMPSLGGWARPVAWSGGLALVAVVLVTGLTANGERDAYQGYYHVVDGSIFNDFAWLGRHLESGDLVTMGESSISWPYPPIAGPGSSVTEANSAPWTSPFTEEIRRMVSEDRVDAKWLRDKNIVVLYTCWPITFGCQDLTNGDLFKVHRGVYLVPP